MSNCTYIDGIASSQAIDTAGEIVDLKGMDCSSLVGAAFNWEHFKDQPSQIVGKILEAKKVFSEEDCENIRQSYYWKKCQMPFLYVMGRLLDDKKPSSKEVAALFLDDAQHPEESDMVGFSVEGAKVEKIGQIITRSIARKVTITHIPANKTCLAEMMPKKEKIDDLSSLFKTEAIGNSMEKLDSGYIELMKSFSSGPGLKSNVGATASSAPKDNSPGLQSNTSNPGKHIGDTKSGKKVFSHAKIHDYHGFSGADHQEAANMHHEAAQNSKDPSAGTHHLGKMKLHLQAAKTSEDKQNRLGRGIAAHKEKIENRHIMAKTLEAGSGMAAPGQLSQGAALAKESLKKKSKWLARAEQEYNSWEKKEQFENFMKKRMPNLAKGEIEAIGKALSLKKSLNAENKLSSLAKMDEIIKPKKD